ncbi:MAG: M1 family metallopeptidase [Chloroflexi bacterium]|nr:M1 family metallopeptidase [Chloroflexota bacterium]
MPLNAVEDAFYLDAVTVTLGEIVQEETWEMAAGNGIVRVPLPQPATPGEELSVVMNFRVVIPPVSQASWPPIGTTGWTATLIQAGEFYPALVPYIDGEWVTWDYHPVGDPTFYPATDFRLTVTTDDPGVTVVSGGFQGRADNIWSFAVEGARGIAFFASPDYVMAKGEAVGVPVYSYYLPDHAQAGEDAVEVAERSLELFTELYGPYPYADLVVVENGFFGGMEYSALASITDYAYHVYQGDPRSVLHTLIAHEVAHQWWYGAVGNHQAVEAWLDESLGFYSELLYYEAYYPDMVTWWWEARVFRYERYGPVDATIYSYSVSSDFILSMYGQAALFVDTLRETMGDEAFFAFLQDYYRTHYGGIVTGRDFFEAVRRHTSEDLNPLLEAYFAETAY